MDLLLIYKRIYFSTLFQNHMNCSCWLRAPNRNHVKMWPPCEVCSTKKNQLTKSAVFISSAFLYQNSMFSDFFFNLCSALITHTQTQNLAVEMYLIGNATFSIFRNRTSFIENVDHVTVLSLSNHHLQGETRNNTIQQRCAIRSVRWK